MRRMWPDEFSFLLNDAEEVDLQIQPAITESGSKRDAISKRAYKARVTQQDFEKILPLAEARYRLSGALTGKAITLIANNPHYKQWHPADGGNEENTSDSGQKYTTHYVTAYFLVDDVRETTQA